MPIDINSNIHINPEILTIRLFEKGKSYKNRDEYKGIVFGMILSDTAIHLKGGHGSFTRKSILQIHKKLKAMGYTTITFERHGKITKKRSKRIK